MKPFIRAMMSIAVVLVVGTVGYSLLEGWTLLEGLYMTVITITTIGFKEVHELSDVGEVFTLFIIAIGMGTVGYAMLNGARLLIEGEIITALTRRRSMKTIEKMSDHYVICGFGRMGSFVCKQLHERGIPFVVIENNLALQDKIAQKGLLLSPGDATDESVLINAGIKSAKGLVSLLASDAANVYVVLTGRQLNPDLEIIARAGEESAHDKLLMAGANRVISPYRIGGMRLVMGILKPKTMSFFEVAMDHRKLDVEFEEVRVSERSPYVGKTLVTSNIRSELNLMIIAVIKKTGETEFNPGPNTVLEGGDTLIAMGQSENLSRFAVRAGGAG